MNSVGLNQAYCHVFENTTKIMAKMLRIGKLQPKLEDNF